ncbi:MAG: hypothetical protein HGA74_04580 [Deltaproteobacteria bacterium]|nr:hypothetical protein [Deltaproteobacteria bacterium]NTV56543.1 hypothetical protein [Deltaproteobacteria bacterium]
MERKMLRRIIAFLMLSGLLWMSGCAKYASTPDSTDYGPYYPYSQREICGRGAVYCGPGP